LNLTPLRNRSPRFFPLMCSMPLEQIAQLPLADNFSVNVQLRIQPNGRAYMAYIQSDYSDWYSFPMQLTQQDVRDLNTELQQAIENVSDNFEMKDPLSAECSNAIAKLARKGNFAFKKIFPKGISRDIVHEALQLGAIVQVTSDDFFIPWELLYDGPLGEQVNASHFWGMQYIISRTLIREARPGDFMPPTIPPRPRVGLIACHELDYVVKKEIPVLQKLAQQQQIQLLSLRPLDFSRRDRELEDLGRFLNEELQIIHLACHARERDLLSESHLLISNEFVITMEDFDMQEFEVAHKPLVLLNACLTGTINPLHTSNWAVLFWKHGARGVLATEFHVPDWFAASFIERLYDQLLSRKPIGEALLTTRRYFWQKEENPLGLGYALYSRPSIRIVNEEEESKGYGQR